MRHLFFSARLGAVATWIVLFLMNYGALVRFLTWGDAVSTWRTALRFECAVECVVRGLAATEGQAAR